MGGNRGGVPSVRRLARPEMITPEEWRLALTNANGLIDWMLDKASREVSSRATPIPEPRREMLAAFALHGQPSGFTWDDVELLRGAVRDEWTMSNGEVVGPWGVELNLLADRIAALLPPREEIPTHPSRK